MQKPLAPPPVLSYIEIKMTAADCHSRLVTLTGHRTMTEREIDIAADKAGFTALEQALAHAYRNAAIAARSYR